MMPQGRLRAHSPEMGQPRSKVPLALGRGNDDHTQPSDCGCGRGLKAETCCDCRLCPQMKAPQGTSREHALELSAEAALANACSTSRSWKKNRQNPNSSPRQPQAVPLTTRRPNPAHNKPREPLQRTGWKHATLNPVAGRMQHTQASREHQILVTRGWCPAGLYRISSSRVADVADFPNARHQTRVTENEGTEW